MDSTTCTAPRRQPWNKGKLVGQKAPLKLKEIGAIRVCTQLEERLRELALFNLAIDIKLRSCDLVKLRVCDVCHGERVAPCAIIMQQKTQRPRSRLTMHSRWPNKPRYSLDVGSDRSVNGR